MRANVQIRTVPLQRGTVGLLGQIQFAALEVDVAELKMMVRLVQVMNLRLQLLDAPARVGSGQFKSPRGGRQLAIDLEKIPDRGEGKNQHEDHPAPVTIAPGVNKHPKDKPHEGQGRE